MFYPGDPSSQSHINALATHLARALTAGVLAILLGACGAGAGDGGTPRIDVDLLATDGAQTLEDSTSLSVEASRRENALSELAILDAKLAGLEQGDAVAHLLVRIALDGELLLERDVPMSLAPEALTSTESFVRALQPSNETTRSGGDEGEEADSTVPKKKRFIAVLCTVFGYCGPGPDDGSGNATIGVRG